jgi:hypothetical protein
MGWLDKLVKPAIRQGDQMEYVDPEQVGVALARAAAETAQPSVADVQGNISEPYLSQGETMGPGPMATPQPDTPEMVQPPDQTTTSYETPQSKQPSIVKPSFEKASTDANGMPAANTPGLTRLGKLFQILGLAAKGGLAGRAASERAVAESGGHRGGGFGTGFEAGLTEAPREAAMNQQVERGALQNEAEKQQIASLPWMRAMQMRKEQAQIGADEALAKWRQGQLNKPKTVTPGVDVPYSPEVEQQKVRIAEDSRPDKAEKGPTNAFQAWYKNFAASNGREPNAKEITDFQRQSAQATHITVAPAGGTASPDDMDTIVRGLVDGSLDVKGVFSRLSAPQRIQAIAQAKRLDPAFDMTTFPARQKVATDFASGKSADQIQSFNTFIGHAKDLSDAVNEFRNSASPLINKPYIWLRKNALNDPQVASYLAKIEPVQKEFESFLLNNRALYSEDRKSAEEILNPNSSPAQMQSAIKSFVHTAGIRLKEVNKRYKNTMHTDYQGLIDPDNQAILQQFGAGDVVKGSPAGSKSAPQEQYEGIRFKELQ